MENFLLFVAASIGATHILVDGSITEPLRNFWKNTAPASLSGLVDCYQCSGFWLGGLMGLLVFPFGLGTLFASACAGSFLASFASVYLNHLEAMTMMSMDAVPPEPKNE